MKEILVFYVSGNLLARQIKERNKLNPPQIEGKLNEETEICPHLLKDGPLKLV